MARLNEPPQPALESIDALKRRFVRQNREIARANSTQSVRIRSLECEVSQLLGENVSLREEVIKLHYEAEKKTSRRVLEGVDIVKGKLEDKLSELGTLVRELGDVHQTVQNQRGQRTKSVNRSSPKTSPDQRKWKNALTFSEAVAGADGRLPPILEHKYYPRRTLNTDEILGVITDPANITDSPDLGPPPVAHFEEGDPIKFDSRQEVLPNSSSPTNAEEAQPKLSANLETRKKRRESSHRKDGDISKANHDFTRTSSSREAGGMGQQLKSGAKRKLIIREEDEPSEAIINRDKDREKADPKTLDSRNTEAGPPNPSIKRASKPISSRLHPGAVSAYGGKEKQAEALMINSTNARKALGPKSVNSDPTNSPMKGGRGIPKDKVAEAKDDLARIVRERNRPKDRPQSRGSSQPKEKDALNVMPTSVEPPPETPAPPLTDLLSPGVSEPSAPRAELRDTPPPPDLGPDTGAGSFGRASRRPKGSVNYAQPNLRDKMRRPTAELVDAVAAEERARQASIAKAAKEASNEVSIKEEPATDALPIWKTNEPRESHRILEEPISPLGNKVGAVSTDLPPSVITERQGRISQPATSGEEYDFARPSSGAASAIAALTAGSHRPKRRETDTSEPAVTGVAEKYDSADRSSIYNFTGSSPPNNDLDEDGNKNLVELTKSRSSRRHSTVSAIPDPCKGVLSTRRGQRRRESIMGEGQEQSVGPALARTKSVVEISDGGEQPSLGRGERAASRRRSMML